MRLLTIVPLLAAAALAGEDGMRIRDIRVLYEQAHVDGFSQSADYTAGPNSMFASQHLDSSDYTGNQPNGFEINFTHATIRPDASAGFCWSLGFGDDTADDRAFGQKFTSTFLTGNLKLGAAIRLGEIAHLELLPLVKFGTAEVEDADITSGGAIVRGTDKGQILGLGGEIGIYFVIANHLVLGGAFQFTHNRVDVSDDFAQTGGHLDLVDTFNTTAFRLGGGYRF